MLFLKIYLLNPPFKEGFVRCGRWQGVTARGGTLDYPKWLSYTTGQLEDEGFKVKLRDAVARKYTLNDVLGEVEKFRPDIVVVETNFSSLKNDLNFVRAIKERLDNDIISIITGPPTAVYPEDILKNDWVDIIARYEYDFVVKDLVLALESGKDLKSVDGIWFKDNNKIIRNKDRRFSRSEELDSLPFVTRVYKDHLNIYEYYLSQSLYPEVQIFTGRGCIYKCTFCSWPTNLMGRVYRVRSIENIADEFQFVEEELPYVKEIFIEDDTFTIDKKRIRAFCKEIIERGIEIKWSCNARADLDYETMKLMKKAGCRLLIVGYESGSDEILKNIKKGLTTKKAREFTKNAKKAGLLIHADFIIGLPGEKHETAKKTLEFIKEIKPDILQVAVATPIPGTEFYEYVKKNDYLLVDDMCESIDENGYQKCIVSYPEFTKEDIEKWVNKILKSYYLNPSYVLTFIKGVIRGGGVYHAKSVFRAARDFFRYIKSVGQ